MKICLPMQGTRVQHPGPGTKTSHALGQLSLCASTRGLSAAIRPKPNNFYKTKTMLQTPLPSDFNLNYQIETLCALLNSWPKIWATTTPIYRVPENFIQGQQQPNCLTKCNKILAIKFLLSLNHRTHI